MEFCTKDLGLIPTSIAFRFYYHSCVVRRNISTSCCSVHAVMKIVGFLLMRGSMFDLAVQAPAYRNSLKVPWYTQLYHRTPRLLLYCRVKSPRLWDLPNQFPDIVFVHGFDSWIFANFVELEDR
jgi:hypothetical protein